MKKLLARGGPLGVFQEYPLLARYGAICFCAETAWAVLIIVLQFHFAEDLFRGEAKQLISSRIATVTLAFVACETLFKVPMGMLADRIGPRRVVFFALMLAAVSPMLMVLTTEWYQFIPLRAMDGLAAAALWPSMSALMARSVPREAKAESMSVFNGAYLFGLAVGPIAGLTIGHKYGNPMVFPLCSVMFIIGLFVARSVLKDGLGDRKPAEDGTEHIAERVGNLLKGRPMLVRMMVLYAASQAAVALFANCAVPYIQGQFGIEEKDLPRLIALPAFFIAGLALPLGRMADTIGRAKAVWISYAMATIGMLAIACTSLMAPDNSRVSLSLAIFSLGILLLAASYVLGTPAWLGLTSLQVDDANQAKTLSLMQTSQGFGVVVGSALVATAGHVIGGMARFGHNKLSPHLPLRAFRRHMQVHIHHFTPGFLRFKHDVIPVSLWMWLGSAVFALCLVGTLVWIRDTEHDEGSEEGAHRRKQPIELSGV